VSRVRIGGRAEALAHLDKAQEFLEAARIALDERWHNAATSSAVLAGINAKDALCFGSVGRSSAGEGTPAGAVIDPRRTRPPLPTFQPTARASLGHQRSS
jgi:hypothetical protein